MALNDLAQLAPPFGFYIALFEKATALKFDDLLNNRVMLVVLRILLACHVKPSCPRLEELQSVARIARSACLSYRAIG